MPFLTPDAEELTDEQIRQLMELGIIPDQQSALQDQMRMAQELRYNNAPEMRGNGRVQTAANPLEFLAAGMQSYKAGKELEEIKKRQAELLDKQVQGRSLYYKNLRRPQLPPTQPDVPLDGGEEYL